MRRLRKHPFFVFQFGLLVLVFVITTLTIAACEEGDVGVDPACGSGNVTWDEKTGICRDRENNAIIPDGCCF